PPVGALACVDRGRGRLSADDTLALRRWHRTCCGSPPTMPSALELTLLLLAASVLAVTVLRVMNLPPVLGYLLVGIVVGPHALALAPDSSSTYELAEFGVVFLMFSIGLEFSLPRLRSMRAIVFGVGLPQVLITLAAPVALRLVLGHRVVLASVAG